MARTFSKATFAALAPALLAMAACQSAGGAISVLSTSPIAAGSTYAWDPASAPRELTAARRIDSGMVRAKITTAVDANLAARGFRRVAPSQARYLIAYDIHVLNSQARDSWFVRFIDYVDAKMVLDITDASSRQVVWRAVSQRRILRYVPQRDLNATFSDMVKALPAASLAARPAPGAGPTQSTNRHT